MAEPQQARLSRPDGTLGAIALGDPYDLPVERKEAKVDPKIFDAYVGEYDFKPKVVMTIMDGRVVYEAK